MTALMQAAITEFSRVDILHNNVGINRKGGAASLTETDWDLVLDTNLKGMFVTCRAVLPIMERQQKGVIVNVSSITAIRYARRPYIAYATSKGGILAFTRTLHGYLPRRGSGPMRSCLATSTQPWSMSTIQVIRAVWTASSESGTNRCRWAAWAPPGTLQRCSVSCIGRSCLYNWRRTGR